jgi:hypothetical protein
MKKLFKVEAVCENGSLYYAVYQKRLFGWKFIKSHVFLLDAIRMAEKLAEPPTYVETKK